MRRALAVGGRPPGRERRRQNTRNPARCQRRIVAGWTSKVAERQAGTMRAAKPMVKRCHGAHRSTDELALGHDELLAQQAVLGDERCRSAEQIGGEACHEPKEIAHGGLVVPRSGARTGSVANTGNGSRSSARWCRLFGFSSNIPAREPGERARIRGTGSRDKASPRCDARPPRSAGLPS